VSRLSLRRSSSSLPACAATRPAPFQVAGRLLLRDDAGQTLLPFAVFMAIVGLGLLAFAVDIGYFFHEKRMVQSAADAAAIAYAEEQAAGDSSNAQAAANAAATLNGFNPSASVNPATVTSSTLSSGNYSNSASSAPSNWYQVTVSQPVPSFFMGAFNHSFATVTVSASAIASGGQSSPTCVCLENTSGMDLNMSNDAKLNAQSCGVTVDSSSSNAIGIVGSANVCASSVAAIASSWDNSGNINNNGSVCSTAGIVQGLASGCSPPMPTAPSDSTCSSDPTNGGQYGTYTVGPNSTYGTTESGDMVCYTAMTVGGNGMTITLNPGIYVINGGELHFLSGTQLGGNGVFFYLENGASLVIDNGANVNLVSGGAAENGGGTAASVGSNGVYNGILFDQQSTDTNTLSVQGGSSMYLNGAFFAPGAAIDLGNGSGSTVMADVVGGSLTMNGGGTLTVSPNANLGTYNTSTAKLSQ
jgi:Flp pilus assembly protein TadG